MISQSSRLKRGRKAPQKPSVDQAGVELQALFTLPEVESWRTLMAAFQAVYRELERALLREDCSISRFQILLILYFFGPTAASEIAKKLCVTRGNISMFLKRLKADGLVEDRDTAGMSKRPPLGLTKKGRELFESLFPGHIRRVRKLVPTFSPEMMKILKQITESGDGQRAKKG